MSWPEDPKVVVSTTEIPGMHKKIYEAVYAICKFLKDKLDARHKLNDRDFHQQFRFTHKKRQLAKDYTPLVFREIRRIRGLDERKYLKSLLNKGYHCLGKNMGKSGSVLYQTNDRRYYLKTITKNEKTFVISMLRAYVHYLKNHPGSFLLNIFGVFRLKHSLIGGLGDLYFMISKNILPIAKPVGQIYDLKGSSIGRKFDPQRLKPGQITIYKDLDLSRQLHFGSLCRKAILQQLNADSAFLRQLGVMDYSLLMGIVRKKKMKPNSVSITELSTERKMMTRQKLIPKTPPPPPSHFYDKVGQSAQQQPEPAEKKNIRTTNRPKPPILNSKNVQQFLEKVGKKEGNSSPVTPSTARNRNIEMVKSNINVNSNGMKETTRTSIRFWRQQKPKDQTIPVPYLRPPPIPKKSSRPPKTPGKGRSPPKGGTPGRTKVAPKRAPSGVGASSSKKPSFQNPQSNTFSSLRHNNTIVRRFPGQQEESVEKRSMKPSKIKRPRPPGKKNPNRKRKRSLPPSESSPYRGKGMSVRASNSRDKGKLNWRRNASETSKNEVTQSGPSNPILSSILGKFKKKPNVEFHNVEIGSMEKNEAVENLKQDIKKEDDRQEMMKKFNQSTSNLSNYYGRGNNTVETSTNSKKMKPVRKSNNPMKNRRRSRSYGNLNQNIENWKSAYQRKKNDQAASRPSQKQGGQPGRSLGRSGLPVNVIPPVERREKGSTQVKQFHSQNTTTNKKTTEEEEEDFGIDRPQPIKKKRGGTFFNMLRSLQKDKDKARQQHGGFSLGIRNENEGFRLEQQVVDEKEDGYYFEEELFFGVIDITQQYGIKKKAALAIRGIKYDKSKLSSIEPGEYQTRFMRFLSQHFVE